MNMSFYLYSQFISMLFPHEVRLTLKNTDCFTHLGVILGHRDHLQVYVTPVLESVLPKWTLHCKPLTVVFNCSVTFVICRWIIFFFCHQTYWSLPQCEDESSASTLQAECCGSVSAHLVHFQGCRLCWRAECIASDYLSCHLFLSLSIFGVSAHPA